MALLDLFLAATMPVIKVLLITSTGSLLATSHFRILSEGARKHLNDVEFYVFNPALLHSVLSETITFKSMVLLWFAPINILLNVIIGSAFGWLLIRVTKPPSHLKGLILGCCAAGNHGNLLLIMVPAICKEKGSPFGDPDTCSSYGLAYVSLSMSIGAIFLWSYVYNIVRESSRRSIDIENLSQTAEASKLLPNDSELPTQAKYRQVVAFSGKNHLKKIFAPSTIGVIVGFTVGVITPLRRILIGADAPLHVIQDSITLLGDAAIPTVTLILGGNLVKGLWESEIQMSCIIGILVVRYIFLPLSGILVVRGAYHLGLVHSDPLYQFVLLIQFAVPPAMNIGTLAQLLTAGESECSVILLWAYALAALSLTLWSTFYMWLVS